jgi:UDP-N-acetylmuramoyl-tripeptide--D-alanyl-D-alanine ligase
MNELLEAFLKCKAVSTDTRSIKSGSIFFALRGENFNGNQFAPKALEQGARYVVVDEDLKHLPKESVFKVDNTLTALQDLARLYRQMLRGTVIGLTGSNGKTTCKELFREVLATTFVTRATVGNLNNHIGVPLTLLSIPVDTEMVIIEMGANHQKEIELLSSICQPDIGFITNYGKAHLEGFGGVEGVIKGKSELFEFLRSRNKKAIVNITDTKQLEKSKGIERITFGDNSAANIPIKNLHGETATASFDGIKVTSQLTGSFHFNNIAAAIALGSYLGVKPDLIKQAIEGYQPAMNRSEWRKTEKNEVLLDAYNANPDSMLATVTTFAALDKPNKWYVLGDMFELGDYTYEEHQRVVNTLENLEAENVVLVGSNFMDTTTPSTYHKFETTDEAGSFLALQSIVHCTVLLKGSRGMKLENLLSAL